MYTFTPDGKNFTLISGDKPIGDASYGSVWLDDIFYTTYVYNSNEGPSGVMLAYDTDSWDMVSDTPLPITSVGTAMVEDNGTVYGIFFNSDRSGYVFGRMDMNESSGYAVTPIGPVSVQVNSMAIDKAGHIYMISQAGDLYSVDKTNGSLSKIGSTGVVPYYTSSACIDKRTGRMFWNVCPTDEHGYIYEVNTSTGEATLMCKLEYGDEIIGMDIPYEADGLAPAAPLNLTAAFSGGSLNGTVSFTCPTTTYDGNSASGELTYRITVNGEEIKTDVTSYGASVSTPITLPASGNITLTVILSNGAGNSPAARTKFFAGADTPSVPANVTATYADGRFTVKWDPVTTTVNNGYMDLSRLTYKVTRMPDNYVVAEATTATSVTDPVPVTSEYIKYYYTVSASCDGKTGAPGESDSYLLGLLEAPWTETFDNEASLEIFTIIDVDDDDRCWKYSENEQSVRAYYHGTNSKNDWLITPGVKLEGGKTYRISFDSWAARGEYPERLEAFIGTSPTVADMTEQLIAETELASSQPRNLGNDFTAPADGTYYLGIHAISDPDQFYLHVDNISISEPISGNMPSSVTDFDVVPGSYGALTATVSGKAPILTRAGNPLNGNVTVTIRRGEESIHEIKGLEPGQAFSYVDTACPEGDNTYSAIASNDEGESAPSTATVYVGIDIPMPVTGLSLRETGIDTGVVHITWTAPGADIKGIPMRAEDLTYRIVNASTGYTIVDELTSTEYDYTVPGAESSQSFVDVAVYAVSSKGESDYVISDMIAVGKPYTLTYKESFDAGSISSILGVERLKGENSWGVTIPGQLLTGDADETSGFAFYRGDDVDDAAILYTGKIDLRNASNPHLSLFTYNITGADADAKDDINEMEILVRKVNGSDADWIVLKRGTVNDLCEGNPGWNLIGESLAAYTGHVIQVGVKAIIKRFAYTYLDGLKIGEDLAHNLAVTSIGAPAQVKRGEEFEVSVALENIGSSPAGAYTVSLYQNGNDIPLASIEESSLGASLKKTVTFRHSLGFDDPERNTFVARVDYPQDMDPGDNVSETVNVKKCISTRLKPSNLEVDIMEDGSRHLSWDKPYSPYDFELIEDDLESYESFATDNVGDWKFVDGDGSPVGDFPGIEFPGIPAGSLQSYFVLDASAPGLKGAFSACSGNKCFASIYRQDEGLSDEWLISPELSGYYNQIDFKATSYHPQVRESMGLYYSKTGRDISDFILVREFKNFSANWGTFSFNVPDGAKYFAIRCISDGGYMIRFDDFVYEAPVEAPLGYNVYLNDEKLNETPVTDLSFVDTGKSRFGDATYRVTALYRIEESEPCEKTIMTSVDSLTSGVTVCGENGAIVIEGAEGLYVTVTDAAGLIRFSGIAGSRQRVSVTGEYMSST